jgi:hypothetical protein
MDSSVHEMHPRELMYIFLQSWVCFYLIKYRIEIVAPKGMHLNPTRMSTKQGIKVFFFFHTYQQLEDPK